MTSLPQLFMRNPNIEHLPPLSLPAGMALHNHTDGCESNWASIIEKAFGPGYSFDCAIKSNGDFNPEYVLYLSLNGKDIATATAVENPLFPKEGWFRMVGVDPCARGIGAGRIISLAAMHSLAARGYKSIVLSTDDERIPAINMYYSLGFRPLYTHESHKARWKSIMPLIKQTK